jgi:predicted HicB family RNase H-like nuclease
MTYKGYSGKIEYDDEAGIFHGEVIDIKDVITFQGDNVKDLKKAFEDSVDDYLNFCLQKGEEPDKPFSGQFIVRIPADLHRKVFVKAAKSGSSLNAWIISVLNKAVNTNSGSKLNKRN